MSKKELTIKPIKASGSKVAKVPKAPKPAKVPVKKGSKAGVITPKARVRLLAKKVVAGNQDMQQQAKSLLQRMPKVQSKVDACRLIECSNACPFGWRHSQYRCFCCSETYLDIRQLREHADRAHTRDQIKLQAHRLSKLTIIKVEVTDLVCILCSVGMPSVSELKLHLKAVHGKKFSNESDALLPFKLNECPYQCQLCTEKPFASFHSLNMHMNAHFKNHICETCGAGFANGHRLSAHKSRHKDKKIECKLCKMTFPSLYKKHAHLAQVHQKNYLHKCPHCPERFKEHYIRSRHLIAMHGASRPIHKCSNCDKTFNRTSALNSHVRSVHLNEKNHECEVCCHKFFRKSDLAKHMASHGGERKFGCEVCGKSYPRKDALVQHMKSHSAEGRFGCSLCSQTFGQMANLRQHMGTHPNSEFF